MCVWLGTWLINYVTDVWISIYVLVVILIIMCLFAFTLLLSENVMPELDSRLQLVY